VRWCQGYSEPGAGSDLASLQTRAEDQGDHFLVNGQKIWNSGGHLADWCCALVRTDRTRKHEGISFLLIDMRSPGVEARPIRMISGDSFFSEIFFTDVRVPKENLVGPLNGGWTIGKRLMQFERSGIGGASAFAAGRAPSLGQLAKARNAPVAEDGQLADGDLRRRITHYEMADRAFSLTLQRVAASGPSASSSILKNVSSQLRQERDELTLEIMGVQGLGAGGDAFSREDRDAVTGWLFNKCGTIGGGSQEIQDNIIANRILGLPDHLSASRT
jgi:alkylation response protein AidB-like acyl-CoA dehydrogenase